MEEYWSYSLIQRQEKSLEGLHPFGQKRKIGIKRQKTVQNLTPSATKAQAALWQFYLASVWSALYLSLFDKIRDSGYTMKCRRCCLSTRQHFFTGRVTQHWHRLPSEVVEFASSEIFKSQHGPGKPAPDDSAWAGGLDKMTSGGPFLTQPFCDAKVTCGLSIFKHIL